MGGGWVISLKALKLLFNEILLYLIGSIKPPRCCDQLSHNFSPIRSQGALSLHQWVCPYSLQGACPLLGNHPSNG